MNEDVKVEFETYVKSFSTDPYACVIKGKRSYFIGWDIFHTNSLVMFTFY